MMSGMLRTLCVIALALAGCRDRHPHDQPPPSVPREDPAIEARRTAALDKLLVEQLAFAGDPCDVKAPTAPIQLGSMELQWRGDRMAGAAGDDTSAYLLMYLRATGSVFEVAPAPTAKSPFERKGFDHPSVTLIIDDYVDPIITNPTPPSQFVAGELVGRVALWHDGAVACGANVQVHNSDVTIVSATDQDYRTSKEDPLSKARIDLVNEAFRAGIAGLRKPSPPPVDCKHQPPTAVAVIDLRGASEAQVRDLKYLDDVAKQLAKQKSPISHRIWLFGPSTFDSWQADHYVGEVERWKAFIAKHAAKDEIAIDRAIPNNEVLVEQLVSSGFAMMAPTKLCAAGAARELNDLVEKRSGIRVQLVSNP